VAKTPQSNRKETVPSTAKASVSSDTGNTPYSAPPPPQDPLEPEVVDAPMDSTSSSEGFPSLGNITIDSRNYMEEGYQRLAQKRANDQKMLRTAELRAVEEQTRTDAQHSQVEAEQQARQRTLVHEQPRKVAENAVHTVTQEQESTNIKPKDQKKKSMLPLLIVLAIGLILGAVGAGYYNRFGFSFPFINDIMEKGQDNTPEKAGLIATPMAQERLLELNRAEIPNGDTEAKRVGESEEFIAAEMSQYPTDPQSTAVQEKNLTYHLVAGSFKVERNAHDLHGELIAKGYESVFLGKIGAYYKVSYQSFNNEDDANNALQALKGKDVSSWMIQYKLE